MRHRLEVLSASPRGAASASIGVALATYLLAGALLPAGLPVGVVLLGVVLGALHGLTAMGIVLVYRSTRIINFAQAEIGGLAAAMAVLLVTGNDVPYVVAVPIGLASALAVGAIVDKTVVRRLASAPKLIGTVAMVGVAQLLGAGQLVLPHLFSDDLRPFTAFKTPFELSRRIGPILFRGDHLAAVIGAVVLVAGVSWFLGRTRTGVGIRAAAEAPERALLAGIPVRRLSTITWVVSAGLSGVAALLSTPIVGVSVGSIAGPSALVIPLTAAVLARMESLPRALAAAVGVTVVQQAIYWSYSSSPTVDLLIFGIVAVGIAVQRAGAVREGGSLAGSAAAVEPRRLTDEERRHPAVRGAGIGSLVILAFCVLYLPTTMSSSNVALLANIAIYCIIVLSALVLTGWSGQISLGQFALVGVGAAATGALIVETNGDLFVELVIAGLITAAIAVVIGAFTSRASGIFLGVVTLAAATAFSSYFFNSAHFSLWTPSVVPRPDLLGRISIQSSLAFYYFCLAFLALAVAVMLGFRRSYIGRAVIAARDNERAAAANAIHIGRARLFAFGFSGFVAGVAGGLYTLSLRGFGFQAFNANESLQIFLLVVIGGLGSIWGALAGAIYGQGVFYFTSGAAELLGTGVGLLLVVLVLPGGFAQVGYRVRDLIVGRIVGPPPPLVDPDLVEAAGSVWLEEMVEDRDETAPLPVLPAAGQSILRWNDLQSGYGPVQVLFGASESVAEDDTLAVVGVNGVGKTTMLKTLMGVVPATAGTVELFGEDVTGLPVHERVRRGLTLVVGGAGVFRLLTVEENLRMGAWTRTDGDRAIAASLQRVQELFPILRERAGVRAELLSGGEQQMLALAMGMMADPKVLLVDELSLGLAPVVVDRILEVLNQFRAEGTVVVPVEQSQATAARLADRVATMARGRIMCTVPACEAVPPRSLAPGVAGVKHRRSAPARDDSRLDLRVAGLSKRFGGVAAVSEVTLEVPSGQFLGIIGANGAGKTTLLDLISGFAQPDEGCVEVLGRDVTGWSPDRRAEIGLGRVFQHARLFPNLTVRETVAVALSRRAEVREPIAHVLRLPAAARSEQRTYAQVDAVLERLGLLAIRDAPTRELSTGTRRAVELACVIGNQPDVLLLDEPTAGIGEEETEALAEVLADLHRSSGATFIMIEHDVDLIARLSERLVCMEQGRVIADGAPAAVLRDDRVLESYLGPSAHGRPVAKASRTRRRQPLLADAVAAGTSAGSGSSA